MKIGSLIIGSGVFECSAGLRYINDAETCQTRHSSRSFSGVPYTQNRNHGLKYPCPQLL